MSLGQSLNPAMIPALAAGLGSLAGALSSGVSNWIAQKNQDRRNLLAKNIFHREQLYADFIGESARAMLDAMQHTFQDPSKLIPVYALISRIRLSSSSKVVESAERVVSSILVTYSKPNLSPQQIESQAGMRDNPLRQFSEICRHELESLASGF